MGHPAEGMKVVGRISIYAPESSYEMSLARLSSDAWRIAQRTRCVVVVETEEGETTYQT